MFNPGGRKNRVVGLGITVHSDPVALWSDVKHTSIVFGDPRPQRNDNPRREFIRDFRRRRAKILRELPADQRGPGHRLGPDEDFFGFYPGNYSHNSSFKRILEAVKGDRFVTKNGITHVYDGKKWGLQKFHLKPPTYKIRINSLVDAIFG